LIEGDFETETYTYVHETYQMNHFSEYEMNAEKINENTTALDNQTDEEMEIPLSELEEIRGNGIPYYIEFNIKF